MPVYDEPDDGPERFSHLAHGSADYGGQYQPDRYSQQPHYGDAGFGQPQPVDDDWRQSQQSLYAGGMPLEPPRSGHSLYDPPVDPFRGDDEEPGIPLLHRNDGMSAGGFNPNVVGFEGAGIGDEEGESLVRYGKIPQRQPRRYKTVKRAFLLAGDSEWRRLLTVRIVPRREAVPRQPRKSFVTT